MHYIYEWTSDNVFIALFCPVNESIWEHLKMVFFPILIFTVFQAIIYYVKSDSFTVCLFGFWTVKFRSFLIGIGAIPVMAYTLQGVFGDYPEWINIVIFFISVFCVYLYEYKSLFVNKYSRMDSIISITSICLLIIMFFVFTFIPPHLPLFYDITTDSYGIPN